MISSTFVKTSALIAGFLFIIFGIGGGLFALFLYQNQKINELDNKFSLIKHSAIAGGKSTNALKTDSNKLREQVERLADAYSALNKKPREILRQEIIREKSQDELLTSAVARVAPSVVSIVVSKDVPKLEIVYVNPFGDDPFFKDFGIQIPQYRQKGTEQKKVGSATGFIISANGHILTNRHVIAQGEAQYTVLLANGAQKQAQALYQDDKLDIAILKVEGSAFSSVAFGDSDSLKLGQSVFAIGNALGEYNNSVSTGIISGLNRSISASSQGRIEKLENVIQTDAAINPGNSGGPLTAFDGSVIGINVATIIGSNNISFAIPINTVKEIINRVVK